jgi:hypothetical protein
MAISGLARRNGPSRVLDGGGAIAQLFRQAAIEPGIGSFGLILGLGLGLSVGWF